MVVGYIRVSTVEQNLNRQIDLMKQKGCEKVFADKLSGKDRNRIELNNMLDFIREGDVVWVSEYARLGRNTLDLLEIAREIEKKGATLISDKEKIDTATPTGKLFLTILAGIAEFERAMILSRQQEGIAIAKANGVYKGRTEKNLVGIEEDFEKWKSRELGITEIAHRHKVSRQTIYNRFKQLA